MITQYHHYSVEFKDILFKLSEDIYASKTAFVHFYNSNKKIIHSQEYGVPDINFLYRLIEENKEVNLDNCYVSNFSLTAYRISRLMGKKDMVDIHSFSASNAFFESAFVIDFSFANIKTGKINFRNTHFAHGEINFDSSIFPSGKKSFEYCIFRNCPVNFSNVEFGGGEVNFKNAVFGEGLKDFQYANFGDGDAIFINTEFNDGDVSFINSNFGNGKTDFKVSRFGNGKVDFHFVKFQNNDISFERTEFGDGKVDFRTAEFGSGRVNFNRAIFGNGEISFEGSQFKDGKFSMKKAEFGTGSINFELLEFDNSDLFISKNDFGNRPISFLKSKVNILDMQSCHINNYLDLRVNEAICINLADTIVRDIIDLKPYESPVILKELNITGMRLLGRIYIDWYLNNVEQLIKQQTETGLREKAEQFRTLKQNFNNTGQYNDEDKSYIHFKRYELKWHLKENLKQGKLDALTAYPRFWFKLLIFDKAGLYATDPIRVMFSMLISFISFSLLYSVLLVTFNTNIVSSIGDPDKLNVISRSFYHSLVTFLTIGYGDYYPSGIIRWISGVEGFVGLFLMSYFTVAFVRKILR